MPWHLESQIGMVTPCWCQHCAKPWFIIQLKTPGGGHRRPPHSVSTSPIAVRTQKHRHSRQTSCGSARSRPLFAREWPNDAGQVGGKALPRRKSPQASFVTSKTFENRARTLLNRALGPPKLSPEPSKTLFLKDV